MTIIITPLNELEFADNAKFEQFLQLLVAMQTLTEQTRTTNALEALQFGRRADNLSQFESRQAPIFPGFPAVLEA